MSLKCNICKKESELLEICKKCAGTGNHIKGWNGFCPRCIGEQKICHQCNKIKL